LSDRKLLYVGRSGQSSALADLRRAFAYPRLSPDGRRLAVTLWDEGGAGIWILDLATRVLARLTPSGEREGALWSPDGTRVTYRSKRDGVWNLCSMSVDGSCSEEPLTTSVLIQFPASWSPDGHSLVFIEEDPENAWDVRVLSEHTVRSLVASPYGEWAGMVSPDGHRLAYASIESGRLEVYVRPFPGAGSKQQVSTEGGNSPVWSRTGRELFYLNGRKMMAAPVVGPSQALGPPVLLFEAEYDYAGFVANFDVTPEGGFIMLGGDDERLPRPQVQIVLNWFQELERRSPSAR